MNFGPSFLNWIHTFYKNISCCVINNGFSSEFFALQRISKSIKGLENGNKITKLSLYADDTTAFIRDNISAASLFDLLDQFGELSGLKINKPKTEGLWLGA